MRAFRHIKRVVVKIGTALLSTEWGIDQNRISDIARQVAAIRKRGVQVLLVSSGAIGMGAKALGLEHGPKHIPLRQACAAIGQPLLMSAYEREFKEHGIVMSQVLITRNDLNSRRSYVNLRASVTTLLNLGVVPVFNENDVVSTSEIGNVFGDNDRMSAMVASKIDADLLILLTDIDGVYTGNPKTDEDAVLIPEIGEVTEDIFSYAKGAGSAFSTGGMKTKLLACQIAKDGGCGTVIASGYERNALVRILDGEEMGTYVHPAARIAARERWILDAIPRGTIVVDDGAKKALEGHASLLPSGIMDVKGVFNDGEVVLVTDREGNGLLKAVPHFNSSDLKALSGKRSTETESILNGRKAVVFRPEDTSPCEH